MTPFEHLAVLISIVIGMGLAHLLNTVHELIQQRARVRVYWLSVLWFFLITVGLVEWWWAIFALRATVKWNFFYFLFLLLSPISLYLSAAFVLPDDSERDHEIIDLRRYYYENSGWLFGTLAVNPALDAIRHGMETRSVTASSVWTNAAGAMLLASMGVVRKPWYHATVTLIVASLFGSFIVSSALQLR